MADEADPPGPDAPAPPPPAPRRRRRIPTGAAILLLSLLVLTLHVALDRARIDLRDTEIRAPVDGAVTHTVLAPGQYAAAGRRIATVIDTQSAWVTANLPENALTRVKPGDVVEVTFNALPGRIFRGRVDSLAFGVARGAAPEGDLAYIPDRRRWLRETQRIPVRIDVDRGAEGPAVRVGSRAAVVVLTGEAGLVAPFARAWLRLVSAVNFAF